MERTALLTDVRRNQERFAALCYRFQESRVRCAQLSAAILHVVPPRLPLYTFVRTGGGSLRMIERPHIEGGSGRGALHCWLETVPGAVVVHADGEVDLATSPDFADAIATAFDWSPRVIINLAGVSYIDGSGLGILKRAGEANAARLAVVGSSPHVRRLFDIVELTGAVPVVATLEAGREYFRHRN